MANDYGVTPGWRVEGFQVDRNSGVVLEVVKPWEPMLQASGEGLVLPDIPTPPEIAGYRVGPGGWRRSEAGGMEIAYEYEGVQPPDGGGGVEPGVEIGVRWSMRGSLYQKDVRTVENWAEVRGKYFWDDAKKEFPEELPLLSRVESTWVKTDDGEVKLNPLRGVKSVDDFSAVLTKTYLSVGIPAGVFSRIGRVVKVPLSGLPNLGDRDWKYMAPEFDEHGNYFRISEHLELSGPGGWNKDLYKELKG